MSNNKLIIAAAGSGKTTYLVDQALSINGDRVLITTFTEVNEREIRNRIVEKKGYMPSNITVKTWFSFLLQHGVRPYQSALNDSIHENDLGFFLTSKKSGQKLDKNGKPMKGGADKKNKMVSGEISFPNGSIKIDSILRLI